MAKVERNGDDVKAKSVWGHLACKTNRLRHCLVIDIILVNYPMEISVKCPPDELIGWTNIKSDILTYCKWIFLPYELFIFAKSEKANYRRILENLINYPTCWVARIHLSGVRHFQPIYAEEDCGNFIHFRMGCPDYHAGRKEIRF